MPVIGRFAAGVAQRLYTAGDGGAGPVPVLAAGALMRARFCGLVHLVRCLVARRHAGDQAVNGRGAGERVPLDFVQGVDGVALVVDQPLGKIGRARSEDPVLHHLRC